MRRIVTSETVGVLCTCLTRRGAESAAKFHNAYADLVRPVEYVVERRGWFRWAVVGYQARLLP